MTEQPGSDRPTPTSRARGGRHARPARRIWVSISVEQLIATLQAEQDPAKPVPVNAIGFGPDTDVGALQQISTATGGGTYVATDPRDIGEIFLDAIGQRLCRPNC